MADFDPADPNGEKKKPSFARIGAWVVVGAIGAYLVLSGIVGIVAKG
jgi:hypothetical protein